MVGKDVTAWRWKTQQGQSGEWQVKVDKGRSKWRRAGQRGQMGEAKVIGVRSGKRSKTGESKRRRTEFVSPGIALPPEFASLLYDIKKNQ